MKTLRNPVVHIANRATAQVDKPLWTAGVFIMENKIEIWKPIPGYEGYYEVSDLGNVRGVERMRINKHGGFAFQKACKIKPSLTEDGYCQIRLSKDGVYKHTKIHQVVVKTFWGISTIQKGFVIDHKNNIPNDNRLCNLQIISESLNTRKDKKNRTSKYPWVYFEKFTGRWRFCFSANNAKFKSRRFKDEEAAYKFGINWMTENGFDFFINELKEHNYE